MISSRGIRHICYLFSKKVTVKIRKHTLCQTFQTATHAQPPERRSKFYTANNVKFETIGGILEKWNKFFAANGVPEPRESIEHILAYSLQTKKISDVYKYSDKQLSTEDVKKISKMCDLRLKRLPVQYVIGEWDFCDLTLKMAPPVFIPRPETEMLVDLAFDEIDSRRCDHVLELCSGSGAICLSLLKSRPQIKVTAVEQSEQACSLTMENARKYDLSERLSIIQSRITQNDRLDFLKETFDVIVSNPPYVPSKYMENLQPEIVMYEDLQALDGGRDGLKIILLILEISSTKLKQNGVLLLEVDPSHPRLLKNYLENERLGLRLISVHEDFCSKERFVKIIKL